MSKGIIIDGYHIDSRTLWIWAEAYAEDETNDPDEFLSNLVETRFLTEAEKNDLYGFAESVNQLTPIE